jgi:4-cresol dehydrogenase (hydroxylating) flavoprotein subunit
VAQIYGLSNGVPTDAALPSVCWAAGDMVEGPPEPDPDHGRCGMLYSLPMIPLKGAAAVEAVRFMESVLARHGFLSMSTLNMMDERCLEIVISIPFRRDDEKQSAAAHACLEELQDGWISRGYYPYRVGVQEMGRVVREGDPFWETVKALKAVFDPNHVIAPRRYNLV